MYFFLFFSNHVCFLVYSYSNWRAYGQSKLANILHANELARRLKVHRLLLYSGVIYMLSGGKS